MQTRITNPFALFLAATACALSVHVSAKNQAPKTVGTPKTKSMPSASAKTQPPKSSNASTKSAKPAKTTTKPHQKSSSPTTSTTSASSATTTAPSESTSATGAAPNGTWVPNNPVAQKLSTKSNLLGKVQRSLGPTTDLNAATAGFKNFGQFVAAVNVSNNLGIKFDDLKAAMTGTTLAGTSTGKSPQSLGQAIQQLKPGVDSTTEVQKAQVEANVEINEPSTTTKKPSGSSKNGHSH
jgi:hypothetical protein